MPPNMSVRIATPSPVSTRLTASMMSLRRCSTSSSGPMVTASICVCGPTTCSSAERNSTASRPCVTRTRPIMENSPRARGCAARKGGHHDHPKPECKGLSGNCGSCCIAVNAPATLRGRMGIERARDAVTLCRQACCGQTEVSVAGGNRRRRAPRKGIRAAATASRGSAIPADRRFGLVPAAGRRRPPRDRPPGRPPRPARRRPAGCRARAPRSGRPAPPPARTSSRPCAASSMGAVVADQPRERAAAPCCGGVEQRQRKPRFAASRTARGSARRGRRPARRRRGRSVRRRPSRRRQAHDEARAQHAGGSSGVGGAPVRFSAQMRPPWASTICLEIDRPRPEFWPKPWCGRSV